MPYLFDWVDAFTTQPFGGNGCVVVHDAADLSIDNRLRLVKETSLAECAYVVPSDVVPSDVVPSDVVPSDVVPSDVVPSDVVELVVDVDEELP